MSAELAATLAQQLHPEWWCSLIWETPSGEHECWKPKGHEGVHECYQETIPATCGTHWPVGTPVAREGEHGG